MTIWSGEIKELEKLFDIFKGHLPDIVKELEQLIKTDDPNVVMLYSRRCLEVIITDLCEVELKRPRKTEPLKGIIDKLNSEEIVPPHIISSMQSLNSLATFGTHPKDFDPEQVKPVLNNLSIIIKWYLKYKDYKIVSNKNSEEGQPESISFDVSPKPGKGKRYLLLLSVLIVILFTTFIIYYADRESRNQQISSIPGHKTVTFNINSEFGELNDIIKERLIKDGCVFAIDTPEFRIHIISDPPGEPVSTGGSADGFQYFYYQTDVRISINNQTPFSTGIIVPETEPRPGYQEARIEYRKKYMESINRNFEEVYNQIKKYASK